MSTTPKTIEDAQKLLGAQLYALDATGALGFEGFMASALSEFTDQAFYVVKSGHQDGTDVRSAPHNFFKVGLEGKRYESSTRLGLDALLHKITDASAARVPVDLWLLAATRPVDVSDREKLHAHGETVGIGIVVLDWPDNLAKLCELAVICTSATTACQTALNPTEPLTKALTLIRQDPEFENMRLWLLDRLTRADTGYASTRLASERWLVEAQGSLANAKSRLGGHHNLSESEYGVIPRTAINALLDDWYTGDHGVAALLGDEGMGKSWAALDWHIRLKSSETGAPLAVFLSARAIDVSDVKSTLAKALAAQTTGPSFAFWKRRLALWERSGGDGVRILILIDGLNENFQFTSWAEWLQPLFEDHLGGMYRVIVSCWPNWWHGSLAGLRNLTPKPLEIDIKGFNDAELNALLAAMAVKRSDFAEAVLELMRVPRLSSLVAKYRDKLKDSGDVTAERVIYEDWKDRLERRGPGAGLTDLEMKAFVTELGNKLKCDMDQAVTRRDVIKSLSDGSGKTSLELRPAVTELSSGAWLKPGDMPNTFRVAVDRIPFVLGATLMSLLHGETGAAAIEARIAEFLDPLKAHRLGAAVLRTATTIALIEADTSPVLRKTLLSRWLDEQNFRVDDFEAFWRLAGLAPALFLDLAEALWLARTGGYFRDEVLIKALANAADFGDFYAALKARLAKWLATAWPDPMVGAVLGKVDQTQATSKQRVAETHSRHKEWASSQAAKAFGPVSLDNCEGWSWLNHRALAILSYRKRASFACVLEAWALSRAIMGRARHGEEVAWLLRLNPDDASETAEAVGGVVTRLEAQEAPICDQAAGYLKAAMSHVERASVPLVVDEGPEETAAAPLDVIGMDASALYKAAQQYLSSFAWEEHDPESSAALINALIERGLDTNEAALGLVLDNLADLLIVLTPDSRDRLRKLLAEEHDVIKGNSEADKWSAARLTLQLYDAEPVEQSALILLSGIGAEREQWLPLYRPIELGDIARADIKSAPASHLAGWLDYVGERLPKEEIGKLDFLPDLIIRDDQMVRHKALVLAAHGRNLPALKAFAVSPYSGSLDGEDKPNLEHEYWRNRALLEFCAFSPDASISKHLSPEYAAVIANHRPTDPVALDRFNQYLRGEFEAIKTEKSWSSPHYWHSYRKAVDGLVNHDLDAVLEWLTPWLKNPDGVFDRPLMDHFPVIDVMQALSAKAPEVSLKLYEAVIDQSRKGIFSSDGNAMFPFEVQASKRAGDLCDGLLAKATTDKTLLEIVCSAHRHNRLDWLFGWIERLEASRTPVDVAKAYTLLGFCDESARADTLWLAFLARPPLDDWLDRVLKASADDYARNRTARNAFTSFWPNDSPSAARHALKRAEATCDMRLEIWVEHISLNWKDCPYERRVAVDLAVASFNQARKKDKERRKKTLFHTRTAFSIMAPWK